MVERNIRFQTENDILSPTEAARINRMAENFSSLIYVRRGQQWASARSITGMLSLDFRNGETVTLIALGDDEVKALNRLSTFLQSEL